ncbi:MAG: DNA-3-methyladenine glycosylase 2 family protein [Pseudomonadota bacterium]
MRPDLDALAAGDPAFAAAYARCGPPPERGAEASFAGLARIVIGQQVSVYAAAAIADRFTAADFHQPAVAAAAPPDALRAVGLSAAKTKTIAALARATVAGDFDFAALNAAGDEEASATIMAQPGLGRWSADLYLLFALRRPDVWPIGDLAIRKAIGRLYAASETPNEKTVDAWGEAFRPRRSAAARFLWHFFKHPGAI